VPIISGGGGGGGPSVVQQFTTTLTPALVRNAATTIVPLAPAPGAGKAYIAATSLWIFDAGFSPYGGVFVASLTLGEDLAQTTVVFDKDNVPDLVSALTGGAEGNVVGTWFGALVAGSQWSAPLSLLDNCPYYFSTSAAPTGGAGNITVVSAMTILTLP